MLDSYNDFLIFKVKDNGEEFRLNITEENFRKNNGIEVLQPSQVAIIIKEGLRRIYIWKGISSSVRQKFIASRVASELQRELMNSSKYHRCKIISVDQGDEPNEFLNTFGFQKTPIILDSEAYDTTIETENEKIIPNLDQKAEKVQIIEKRYQYPDKNEIETPTYEKLKEVEKSKKILERVLSIDVPNHLKRKNILIGTNQLYGMITKKTEIFNKSVEENKWEVISSLPKETVELEGHKIRIHFNVDHGDVEAIELLENSHQLEEPELKSNKLNYKQWTVKQLKQFCRENNIKVLSSYRKADIVRLVTEFNAVH
jgi:hypothetical protein